MKLFMLAAGLGTRLRPLTNKIPKPAVPVLTVPMIFYPYYHFNNITSVVVNTFHFPNILKSTLVRQARNFATEIISDGKSILGSGGGIKNAESLLKGSGAFAVSNSDAVFLPEDAYFLEKAKMQHRKSQPMATIVVIEDQRIEQLGWGAVWVDEHDKILDIGKVKPAAAVKGYHYIGFLYLDDKMLDILPKGESNIFGNGILKAIAKGLSVQLYKAKGIWFEMGSAEEYLEGTGELLKHFANGNLFLTELLQNYSPHAKLSTKENQQNIQADTSTLNYLLTKDTYQIDGGVNLGGFVVIGRNVIIEAGCHLKNVVILDNVTVKKNTEATNQIIY